MSECRTCRAPVTWILTENGKRMPLDAWPETGTLRSYPDGNIVHAVNDDGTAKLSVDARTGGDLYVMRYASAKRPAAPGAPLYKSHFATCPDAAQHRR